MDKILKNFSEEKKELVSVLVEDKGLPMEAAMLVAMSNHPDALSLMEKVIDKKLIKADGEMNNNNPKEKAVKIRELQTAITEALKNKNIAASISLKQQLAELQAL